MRRLRFRPFRSIALIISAITLAAMLGACGGSGRTTSSSRAEQKTAAQQLGTFEKTQPVPSFPWSQLRQTLTEIETAQANTVQTTSFFFNMGVQDPISSCPSIGFPVPATDELTNPQKVVGSSYGQYGSSDVIGNLDPTGVYSGDTTGTYVLCVAQNGKPYAKYWEGFVETDTGAVAWDYTTHRESSISNITGNFSVGKK